MDYDLSVLDHSLLRWIVALLLLRSGYKITQVRPFSGYDEMDLEAFSPYAERVFVEVKPCSRALPATMVARFADDVKNYRRQCSATKGLLVVLGNIPESISQVLANHPEIEIWNDREIISGLIKHPDLTRRLREAVDRRLPRSTLVTPELFDIPITEPDPASAQFRLRLTAINPGRGNWRLFEVWCTEILTEIFRPCLGPPDQHSRTDDTLDIMDAVFPIRATLPPWSQIREEYRTRFVVSEYKNYADGIGQKEVESIAQYLWARAKRQFGILVSRKSPTEPALAQRRRCWVQDEKMIVFLSAVELIEMLEMRETGAEPFSVIDAQIETFLRPLTP